MIYVSEGGHSGYAMAAQAYLVGLLEAGQDVSWSPRAWKMTWPAPPPSGIPALDACREINIKTDCVLFHVSPERLPELYQEFSGYQHYVYTVWETDSFPARWVASLNQARRVLVPCKWNREVLQRAGVTVPIAVIPHVVDQELVPLTSTASLPLTFYSVGPWSRRKGHDLLVEAFCRAFSQGESVRLVIKTEPTDFTRYSEVWALRHLANAWNTSGRALNRILCRHLRPPEVQLICRNLSRPELVKLHTESHCYVSLARSEGWGLGAFDAATVGNPVIITGYGGQLDYLDPALCSLIGFRHVPCVVERWERNYAGQNWAEPDLDHAAGLMREAYADFPRVRRSAQELKAVLSERFSRKRVIPALLEALEA